MKRIMGVLVVAIFLMGCATINTKFIEKFQSGSIHIGMSKQELINQLGYPPEGKSSPDMFYSQFTTTKVTSEGTEELWTYQYGVAPDLSGVRSVTFKIINNEVKEWRDWVDSR